jgi:hypothetical protein
MMANDQMSLKSGESCWMDELTGTHVVDAASAKLLAKPLSGRQPKISDRNAKATIKAQNVLWLQVAVINTKTVAILDCIKQLQEDMLDKAVIS